MTPKKAAPKKADPGKAVAVRADAPVKVASERVDGGPGTALAVRAGEQMGATEGTHDIQTTMQPWKTITVGEAEYESLLTQGLVYSGDPVSPVADGYDLLFANEIGNGVATPPALAAAATGNGAFGTALRAAFDAVYTPVTTTKAVTPLVPKKRSVKAIPNSWSANTAQQVYPENAVWDPDTNQYVGVYMAQQSTPSSFAYCCYWTAPSLAAIKAGQLTDGGIIPGVGQSYQTPHLMREGGFWYLVTGTPSGTGLQLWRSTTSPAGGQSFSLVQSNLITLGTIATISAPATPTVTATTGGPGTLPAATHSYKITALTAAGETTASAAASATLAATGYCTVSWTATTGETNGYVIYKQTAPGNLYMQIGTVAHGTTSYQDNTGAISGTPTQPPLQNLSGSFDYSYALEEFCIRIPHQDPLYQQGYRYAMYYMGKPSGGAVEQVGIAVSPTLNASGWTKLNGGNPVIPCGRGYASDADGSADPFVWIAPNGKIVVFYVGIEYGGVAKSMRWHYNAAVADTIAGPYTKLGTVIQTPSWPDVGKNGSSTWSTGTYPAMSQMNGDEGGVWRGSFIRDDADGEVIWLHAGKNLTGAGNSNTLVQGFVDTFDLSSPLLRGIVAVNPWERVEAESGDPRWTFTGTWTQQTSSQEYSGDTIKFSTTTGDTATFGCFGVGVRLGLAAYKNAGIAEIYVDGVYDRTLDLYAPGGTIHSPVLYEKTGLTPGYHNVQVKVVGENTASSGSVVVVDYAEVCRDGTGL